HGDPPPSSVGGIGTVYEGQGKKAKYYENRSADVVDALQSGEHIDVGATNVRVERIWGWDGGDFFLSQSRKVFVEESLSFGLRTTISSSPTSQLARKLGLLRP